MSLLRDVLGDERAEAIAAAVIPEASTMTETLVPPEKPEEGATGEQPGPEPQPGTEAKPQGSLL